MHRPASLPLLGAFSLVSSLGCAAAPPTQGGSNDDTFGPVEVCDEGGPITVDRVRHRAGITKHPDPAEIARAAVHCELAAIDWEDGKPDGRFSLSVSVVELTTEQVGHSMVATSKVSATVTHDERGLIATLRGSGRAEDVDGLAARAERDAIDSATRGALRRLHEAVVGAQ